MNSASKALRQRIPRAKLCAWDDAMRAEDPLAALRRQESTRIPALLPIRHQRMRSDPFAFLRGSAAIAASDFAALRVTGLRAQLCGDAHLLNFGTFTTPKNELVFDIVNFDETLPGPWEWDMLRLCSSIVVFAASVGIRSDRAADAVIAAAQAYREAMNAYAQLDPLAIWYDRVEIDPRIAEDRAMHSVAAMLSPALAAPNLRTPRFVDRPPLFRRLRHADERVELAHGILRSYRASLPEEFRTLFDRYHNVDMALNVVGVGSVGSLCLVVLLLAETERPLILQIKEAQRSVLERPIGLSRFAHHGERVVVGERLMQATSDPFLGWSNDGDRDFYVRRLRDLNGSLDTTGTRAPTLIRYAHLCARALARAHARSGEPRAIGGYLGNSAEYEEAMLRFALAYGVRCERDYSAFVAACARGEFALEE
ncbi:MAG: DUF2252 domain-containing protein [Candidatus Eremiobacteraeota bacterium]|uniref:DUF2252 domain-containing protein n=1 Tax=mine drainage metagenome TaxID=410659 RepID=E6PCI7_9ZZZZ|nr:DUF2252 domain-containing protein [Candidatus Eremiobacteraeota bacterium]